MTVSLLDQHPQHRVHVKNMYIRAQLRRRNGRRNIKEYKRHDVCRQVHPVVTRLCAAIEGTDPARLADCLGLDPSRFRGAAGGGTASDAREDALVSGSAYFDDEDRFKVAASCRPRCDSCLCPAPVLQCLAQQSSAQGTWPAWPYTPAQHGDTAMHPLTRDVTTPCAGCL